MKPTASSLPSVRVTLGDLRPVSSASSAIVCGFLSRMMASSWRFLGIRSRSSVSTESKLMPLASRLLVRQTHDERQGDIKSSDVLVVEVANMPSDSFAPDRDRLIGHHLRFHP